MILKCKQRSRARRAGLRPPNFESFTATTSAQLNACDLSGYVHPRIAPDGPEREAATLRPSERPGLGVSPDPEILGEPVAVFG